MRFLIALNTSTRTLLQRAGRRRTSKVTFWTSITQQVLKTRLVQSLINNSRCILFLNRIILDTNSDEDLYRDFRTKDDDKADSSRVVRKHNKIWLNLTNKFKANEEYLLNRYEIIANNQMKSFEKTLKNFKSKLSEENVGKITLREISKRIDQLRILKSKRLKDREFDI